MSPLFKQWLTFNGLYHSIMCSCITAKKEPTSIAVCYLNNDDIHEEFLDLTPSDFLDALSLLTSVKQTLA